MISRNPHAARAGERKAVKLFWSRAANFEQQNRIASTLILSDIEHFGGEGSGLVRWARAFTERTKSNERMAA